MESWEVGGAMKARLTMASTVAQCRIEARRTHTDLRVAEVQDVLQEAIARFDWREAGRQSEILQAMGAGIRRCFAQEERRS